MTDVLRYFYRGQRVCVVARPDTPLGDPLVGKRGTVRELRHEDKGAWVDIDCVPAALTGDSVLPARTGEFYEVDRYGRVLLSPAWCEPA